MKVIKKNVYYCDFCKKKSLRSLKIHEKHCTANPEREYRLCGRESIKEIIEKYRKYFTIYSSNYVIFKKKFKIRDLVSELDYICPNCILAIIRCLNLNRWYLGNEFKFDYKKALYNWWKITNEEQQRQNEDDSIYY